MKKFLLLCIGTIMSSASLCAANDSDGMPIFYLRGNFQGTNWEPKDSYRFSRSGNDYSLTINQRNAIDESEFKIAVDDWTLNYGADVTVNESQYVSGVSSGANMKTDGFNNAVISFTYNPDSNKATIKFIINGVEPGDPEPQYPEVFLKGDFNGTNWMQPDSRYKFTYSEGKYTLNITNNNPITAGSSFKIGTADWFEVDLGGNSENLAIDNTQTITLISGGKNLTTINGISEGSISFAYPYENGSARVTFDITGTDPAPVAGLSGSLPVLYINVYTDESHSNYNDEIISKDLSHKNYFEFAEYWLETNNCEWLEELGAENVGSKEKPLALQIKARGNWTRIGFSKKPFKLKLDKKQSLLSLSKSKHFAILAHADDNSGYLRNFVGFNLGKRIGLPWTPSQQPVEVVINGDYRGLYFLTESIRVDEDRVNIRELGDNVDDSKLVSGGYIVELDNYDEDEKNQIKMEEKHLPYLNHNYDALRITFDTPEEYSDLQRRFITDQFSAMNNFVGNNDDALWSYLDLDDAARFYVVQEIVSNVESYHGSTYLFRDYGKDQKWHFSPLWDFGNAFNGYTDSFFYNCDPFGNTWIPSMRENGKFNQKVKETWLWFMSNKYAGLENDIDTYVSHVNAAAQADYKRWEGKPIPSGGQPVADNRNMGDKANGVKSHLRSKTNWLKSQFGDYTNGTFSEPARDTTLAADLPPYVDLETGVENIENIDGEDSQKPIEYYNLQGLPVARPEKGQLYIIRKGTKSSKIFIK